jgi:putative endonuclease
MVGQNASIAVYITASGRNGTLYLGVTSELQKRIAEHKHGAFPGFSKTYRCTRLVWYEPHGDMRFAIQREKNLKRWNRAWKLELIEALNPDWRELSEDWW